MGYTENLIDFIGKSTDCYHAVKTAKDRLDENGFTELLEGDKWDVQSGGKYYVIRNSSSIIAFEMPKKDFGAFMICASHTDSPSFKLKPDFEINADGCIKLSVEGYGGMIMSSWLDRPLSISGRIVTAKNGKVETKLVNIERDLLVIPSLAIHMSRDINKGYEFNIRRDMCPIASDKNGRIEDIIAENVGVDKEEILGFDLSLYNRMRGTVLGADGEYFSAPRIDDLQCMYSTLDGFLNSETYKRVVAKSFMLSCDNAHAVHPNFADKSDSTNRVYMNGGIVIKYNANQRYTTDAVSEAVVKYVCKNTGVPYQMYANRSDIPGGSTLGNLSNEKVSLNTADIGLAQLAMHSSYETAGSRDTEYMVKMIKEFYKTEIVL